MSKLLSILAILWFILACLAWDIRNMFPITVRPDDIIILVMAALVLQKKLFSGRILCFSKLLIIVSSFVLFLVCVSFLSYLLNAILGSDHSAVGTFGLSASTEMLKEYVRLGKYLLVIFVFTNLDHDMWKAATITIAACCIPIIIVQLLQYAQVDGLNEALSLVYGDGDKRFDNFLTVTSAGTIDLGEFRSGSIFGNPNVMGGFLVAPVAILVMLSIEKLKDNTYSALRKAIIICVTCFMFLGVFMTQSRTALGSCLLAVIAGLVAARRNLKLKMRHVIIGVGAIIVLVSLLTFIFSGKMTRYTSEYNERGSGKESLSVKTKLTLDAISNMEVWQLFTGEGPAQSDMVDNEVGYMILWYGILGLIAYYVVYFLLYKVVVIDISDSGIRSAFVGILVAYLLVAIGSSAFLNIRIFPVFLALLAIASMSKSKCAVVTQRIPA